MAPSFMKLVCVGLVAMLALAPHAEAAVSCGVVYSALGPCQSYISTGKLDPKCCSGIKTVLGKAGTTADRQDICKCLKGVAASVPGAAAKTGEVVKKCGVSIPYSLSPSTNCATVK